MRSKALSIEKARKEAVTDGLKRALKSFGNGLGNCLNDKNYLRCIGRAPKPPEETLNVTDMKRGMVDSKILEARYQPQTKHQGCPEGRWGPQEKQCRQTAAKPILGETEPIQARLLPGGTNAAGSGPTAFFAVPQERPCPPHTPPPKCVAPAAMPSKPHGQNHPFPPGSLHQDAKPKQEVPSSASHHSIPARMPSPKNKFATPSKPQVEIPTTPVNEAPLTLRQVTVKTEPFPAPAPPGTLSEQRVESVAQKQINLVCQTDKKVCVEAMDTNAVTADVHCVSPEAVMSAAVDVPTPPDGLSSTEPTPEQQLRQRKLRQQQKQREFREQLLRKQQQQQAEQPHQVAQPQEQVEGHNTARQHPGMADHQEENLAVPSAEDPLFPMATSTPLDTVLLTTAGSAMSCPNGAQSPATAQTHFTEIEQILLADDDPEFWIASQVAVPETDKPPMHPPPNTSPAPSKQQHHGAAKHRTPRCSPHSHQPRRSPRGTANQTPRGTSAHDHTRKLANQPGRVAVPANRRPGGTDGPAGGASWGHRDGGRESGRQGNEHNSVKRRRMESL
ncbi:protein piccolo-like isoform X2 [Acanthaster planci]|nr:protein piccolo-like isoform X2 [Acanthaster planci]